MTLESQEEQHRHPSSCLGQPNTEIPILLSFKAEKVQIQSGFEISPFNNGYNESVLLVVNIK